MQLRESGESPGTHSQPTRLSWQHCLLLSPLQKILSNRNYYQTQIHNSISNPWELFYIFSSPQHSFTADDFAVLFDEKTSTAPSQTPPTPSFSTFSPLTDFPIPPFRLPYHLCPWPYPLIFPLGTTPDIPTFVTSLVNSSLSSGCFNLQEGLHHHAAEKTPPWDPSIIQKYRRVSLLPFLSETI